MRDKVFFPFHDLANKGEAGGHRYKPEVMQALYIKQVKLDK